MVRLRWLGSVVVVGLVVVTTSAAGAIVGPSAGSPRFAQSGVNQVRVVGSDALLPLMNSVSALYSQSQLAGCTLSTVDNRSCIAGIGDTTGTDSLDNYARTEVLNGLSTGDTAAATQLCGSQATGGLSVDLVRIARAPRSGDCPTNPLVGLQIAVDSVPAVTFPYVNLATPACSPGDTCTTTPVLAPAGGYRIGDVAGNPSGVPFDNLDNRGIPALGGRSVAYELLCDRSSTSHQVTAALTTATLITASAGSFSSSDIGAPVFDVTTPTNLAQTGSATFVTSVPDASHAVLNQPPAGAAASDVLTVGTGFGINDWQQLTDPTPDPQPRPPTASDATLNGSMVITTANPDFSGADLGAAISGAGILPGTTITSVPTSTSITVNQATIPATSVSLTIDDVLGREGRGTISSGVPEPIYFPLLSATASTYLSMEQFLGCDPNTKNVDRQVIPENDAPALWTAANSDHPTDNIAADNQVAESIYYESYGVTIAKPYTSSVATYSAGAPTRSYGRVARCNEVPITPLAELRGPSGLACSRGLFLAYGPGQVRGSTAGFVNWLCDVDPAGGSTPPGQVPGSPTPGNTPAAGSAHGVDITTGLNYSRELTNTITTQLLFPRTSCGRVDGIGPNATMFGTSGTGTVSYASGATTISDTQAQGPLPARTVTGCDVTSGATTLHTDTNQGHFGPLDIGATVTDTLGFLPPGTTILTVADVNTVTLSAAATATTTFPLDTITITDTLPADLRESVTGAGIPTGTFITGVTPGVGFTVNQATTAAGSSVYLPNADPLPAQMVVRVDGTGGIGSVNYSAGATAISDSQVGIEDNGLAGTLGANYEVGETVTGAGVPFGTTITSVTPGVSFTLSQPTTASGTSVTIQDTNL